jgi:hypothetical protein
MGPVGARARGREAGRNLSARLVVDGASSRAGDRKELDGARASRSVVDGASSRAGDRKELEGGRLARRDRRETFGNSTGRPAGVCFLVSEANERPAVA